MDITKAMVHLVDLGVKHIIIEYSGSGDSGAIDGIAFSKIARQSSTDSDEDYCPKEMVNRDVYDIIDKRAYNLLDDIEDWYNNDGGYGKIIIQVPSGEYTIENNINIMDVETYYHEGKLTDKD